MSKLTDTKIKNLKATDKLKYYLDGNYLYLTISPKGAKSFVVKYTYFDNEKKQKNKKITIGQYPVMSLKEARDEARIAVEAYKAGDDYSQVLKDKKQEAKTDNSFKYWSNEWLQTRINNIDDKSYKGTEGRLKNHILPVFGKKKITDIKAKDVIALIQSIQSKGTVETGTRCKQIISQIFRYCIINEVCSLNPANDIDAALQKSKSKPMLTITEPNRIGGLLRHIDTYRKRGTIVVSIAMELSPYLMLRPSEVCRAKWEFIDFNENIWKIPADEMKKERVHVIPLSSQVKSLLRELFEITGGQEYLFPNRNDPKRHMSNNAVNSALKRLGYRGVLVPHGFRSMASTLLNEKGYNSDWIEKQLAHVEGNSIRRAYNHAEYLEPRKNMMQDWADYLDELRNK